MPICPKCNKWIKSASYSVAEVEELEKKIREEFEDMMKDSTVTDKLSLYVVLEAMRVSRAHMEAGADLETQFR